MYTCGCCARYRCRDVVPALPAPTMKKFGSVGWGTPTWSDGTTAFATGSTGIHRDSGNRAIPHALVQPEAGRGGLQHAAFNAVCRPGLGKRVAHHSLSVALSLSFRKRGPG